MTDETKTFGPEENEIMAAAREAKARQLAAESTPEPARLSKWGIAAIGAGVGSAAVAAAVIYANRNKRKG
ncbi:MAG: hypothetical protein E7773_10990 [Sphingomonas sp.]|uniref:hypothetical protein n=1 Tax=Sphingomonas sp. TaxID=28214 RepID=UPI0012066825|nr:hypothetical protein [Sphingomonas sp.]THD35626.1 MAG: hypothetical protein E7773_10990 [Sphingomonas sp.]